MSEENKTDLDPVDVYRHPANGLTAEEAAQEVVDQIKHNMGLDAEPNMAADLRAHVERRTPAFIEVSGKDLDTALERAQEQVQGMIDGLTPREEPVQREPLRLPSYEETMARRTDPYERAKAEARERRAVPAENLYPPANSNVEEGDPPTWSLALAESKPSLQKVEYLLEQGPCRLTGDAGAMARDALKAVQNVKRENRRKRIRFWTGWLVFLLLVAAVAFGTWKVLPDYVVTGRYTVPSECSAPLGKGEITGTREYSYAYKSLFGYHLVDESTALEKTVVNIKGDRMTILGWDKATGKTWRQNIDVGEKGIAILKHADIYWFLTDKDMATVPYTGFCK